MSSDPQAQDSTSRLYKVLVDGQSAHGGSLTWPLPVQGDDATWTPGEWVEVVGDLAMCAVGIHLTREPVHWWLADSALYAAEYDGELVDDGGEKVCCRRVRLLREVPWAEGRVFSEGEHSVRDGLAHACGSATVRAFGSATVRASGSATVRAFGSATVRAFGSATVEASDSATVEASDLATVISDGWHSPSAVVALEHMAAHVDRRGGVLVLRGAKDGKAPPRAGRGG